METDAAAIRGAIDEKLAEIVVGRQPDPDCLDLRPAVAETSGIVAYLSFPGHAGWLRRYAEISAEPDCFGLLFTPEFRSARLPADGTSDFDVELLDSTDGAIYRRKMSVACEGDASRVVADADGNVREVMSLHGYFYAEHYCPCNRKLDAQRSGAVVEDDECEGDRFRIRSITCPGLPGLVLYSETMDEGELMAGVLGRR